MPEFDDDDGQNDDGQAPNWRRKLEADAKAGREAQAELAKERTEALAAKQELAMRRAGIDPADPLAVLLAKANPELVDVDSFKAQWEQLRPPGPQVPADQQAAMARIQSASSGGATASGGATPDFEAELDAIPMLVNGTWNPDYQEKVLGATQVQAAREGRQFETSGGRITFEGGGSSTTPAITPISS